MGELLVRNLDDSVAAAFEYRARVKGTSLEHEVREALKTHARLTPEEKLAISRDIRSRQASVSEPLTREEIRDGLE